MVENRNANPHLHLSDIYRLLVVARRQENAIQVLSTPEPQQLTPKQTNTEYSQREQFLSDAFIYDNLFYCDTTISAAFLQHAAKKHEARQNIWPLTENKLYDPVIVEELELMAIDNEEEIDNGDAGFDLDDEGDFEDREADIGTAEREDVGADVSIEIRMRICPSPGPS